MGSSMQLQTAQHPISADKSQWWSAAMQLYDSTTCWPFYDAFKWFVLIYFYLLSLFEYTFVFVRMPYYLCGLLLQQSLLISVLEGIECVGVIQRSSSWTAVSGGRTITNRKKYIYVYIKLLWEYSWAKENAAVLRNL